jgi:fermentation-respiration switch protein FrsA (DUF1100 family)
MSVARISRLALSFGAPLLALAYAGVTAVLYAREDAMLFKTVPNPDDARAAGIPGLHDVRVQTADGLSLIAWFRPPPPGAPTLLYLHGNGGSLGGRLRRIRMFAASGLGLMCLEYRGYGPNAGKPSEVGLNLDAHAALAFLADRDIQSTSVILYGESLGTGVAVRLATEKPVAAVLLDSPYTSIAAIGQGKLPYLPVERLMRNRFDLLGRIDKINAPVLIMQGAKDRVVPPAMGQKVFAAARQPKAFWQGPESTHRNVAETGGWQTAEAFIKSYVRQV